jgi:hypothetical protein
MVPGIAAEAEYVRCIIIKDRFEGLGLTNDRVLDAFRRI